MKDFFAKKPVPPKQKIDPARAKRTIDALKKPPPSLPKSNYERIIEKSYVEASRSGSTCSDQRLAQKKSGEKIPQLGEQENQSCPPLKVPSHNVANDPRMVPGYSNLADYLPDDVHYEPMEVQIQRYEYGKPLIKDERSLSMMMRRLHDWYLKICRDWGEEYFVCES